MQVKGPKPTDVSTRSGHSAAKRKYVPTKRERRGPAKAPQNQDASAKEQPLNVPELDRGSQLFSDALCKFDPTFASGILWQLAETSKKDGKIAEGNVELSLSFIRGLQPRDELEATLAVQMSVIHTVFIDTRCHLLDLTNPMPFLSELNKLARTFTIQMDALKGYRSKGEQKVTVQHVTVSEGGQAIVGDIHQAHKEGATSTSPPSLPSPKEQPMATITDTPRQASAVIQKPKK